MAKNKQETESTTVATQDESTKALETKGNFAVVNAEDAGAGFEDITQDELQVPYLAIIQSNSPQLEEGNGKYIEGAKAGMIYNTVTNETYDGKVGIPVIPVHREQRFLQWVPRDEGGGLKGVHKPTDQLVLDAKKAAKSKYEKLTLPDGDELAETFSVYSLQRTDEENTVPIIIAFGSTQIKHYKSWMTKAMSIPARTAEGKRVSAPLYSHGYRLKTKTEKNKKGTWFGWSIDFDGPGGAKAAEIPEGSELYEAAKLFRSAVTSGAVTTTGFEDASARTEGGGEGDTF
jgi:hypothetical protein